MIKIQHKIKHSIFSLLLIIGMHSNIYSKGAGTSAFDALNIPIGSREMAMGAASAVSSPLNSFWWNPAALADLERMHVSFMYNKWIQDISQQRVGFSFPMTKKNVGSLNIFMLDVAGIEGYSWQDTPTGEVKAQDMYISYTQAKRFSQKIAAGLTLKGLLETLETESAFALGFDIGTLYTASEDTMWISAGIKNLGAGSKFIAVNESMPTSFFIGTGMQINNTILLSCDLNYLDSIMSYGAGAEFNVWKLLFLRLGWNNIADVDDKFKAGAGWKIGGVSIDYAYAPFSDLGTTHRADIHLRIGAPSLVEKMYKQARKFYKQKLYDEAWIEFNKVESLEPGYKKAKAWIEKIQEKIHELERKGEAKEDTIKYKVKKKKIKPKSKKQLERERRRQERLDALKAKQNEPSPDKLIQEKIRLEKERIEKENSKTEKVPQTPKKLTPSQLPL